MNVADPGGRSPGGGNPGGRNPGGRNPGGRNPGGRNPGGGNPGGRNPGGGNPARPTGGFQLVPLDCRKCGAPLAAEATDVVFYCTACRSGFRYDPTAPGSLASVEVAFVASTHQAAEGYAPFWLVPARITRLERDAGGGVFNGLMGFLMGSEGDTSPGEGTFVLPAFQLPIRETVELALRYTREFPRLDQLLGERLTGGTVSPEDARKLAHYVLVASEVRKSDTLKDLHYEMELGEPRLLGVPWIRSGPGRADALFGLFMGNPEG